MSLPDDIAADLPPPRDDEPASLRRDILDELADHLASALDRERQREGAIPYLGGTSAWQRVLDRFGNPSVLALRLWREAMRESLIMQRITTWLTIAVLGAVCLGMVLQTRYIVERQHAVLAEQRRLAETMQQLNEQVQRATSRPQGESSIEWVPVEISLQSADPGQTLPDGFQVRLTLAQNTTGLPPWEAKTERSAPVRFPLVRYGRYVLLVEAPWGEVSTREINVNPGTPLKTTVLCPATPLTPVTVKPELLLPDDLQARPLYVTFPLGAGTRPIGGQDWRTLLDFEGMVGNGRSALLGADGRLRPRTSAGSLDPFLAYDAQGAFEGIHWPDPTLKPDRTVFFQIEREFEARAMGGRGNPMARSSSRGFGGSSFCSIPSPSTAMSGSRSPRQTGVSGWNRRRQDSRP